MSRGNEKFKRFIVGDTSENNREKEQEQSSRAFTSQCQLILGKERGKENWVWKKSWPGCIRGDVFWAEIA